MVKTALNSSENINLDLPYQISSKPIKKFDGGNVQTWTE